MKFQRIALVTTTLLALAAPAFAQLSANLAEQPKIKIVIPLDSSASFDQALTETVTRFNARKKSFSVELLRRGNTFQSLRSIIASHYANDLPDAALVGSMDLPTLTALGIVQKLPDQWLAQKRFVRSLTATTTCESKPCSAPFQRRVPVWVFNKELLFKMNQNPEQIPSGWNALAHLSKRLQLPQNDVWGIALPSSGDASPLRWTALGLNLLNPVDNAADWVEKMWLTKASLLPNSPSVEEVNRRFFEQKAVLALYSIDQLNYLETTKPFKWGARLPDGELQWFGTDFVIFAKDGRAAWVREFLDYLYESDTALELFKTSLSLPVIQTLAESAAWKNELKKWPLVKTAMERKLKASSLEKIAPHLREEWTRTVWQAFEQPVEASEKPAKLAELKTALRKLLSTSQH